MAALLERLERVRETLGIRWDSPDSQLRPVASALGELKLQLEGLSAADDAVVNTTLTAVLSQLQVSGRRRSESRRSSTRSPATSRCRSWTGCTRC